jgi:transposase-like protein
MEKTIEEQEAIIAEYLMSETTYRKLEKKYGVDFRTIHYWVMKYQGKDRKSSTKPKQEQGSITPPTEEVKHLQEELRKANLHNKLLNAMIDIAEEQLKIDIRKKSGTKR